MADAEEAIGLLCQILLLTTWDDPSHTCIIYRPYLHHEYYYNSGLKLDVARCNFTNYKHIQLQGTIVIFQNPWCDVADPSGCNMPSA